MKLGNDSNFLEVIAVPGSPGIYAVRARMSDSHSEFFVRNDVIVFDTSESIHTTLASFSSLETDSFVLPSGGGGAITLTRDIRGSIRVSYKIPSWDADTVIEGQVHVDGEFSATLLRDFAALLRHA